MQIYLGIDDGGTKTDCAISNGVELLGQAAGESCKMASVGKEKARKHLQEAILNTCKQAKVSPSEVQHVCIGMSGASIEEAGKWAGETLKEVVPGQAYIVGDHVIAYRTAFGTFPGVLVSSGTGYRCFGPTETGE